MQLQRKNFQFSMFKRNIAKDADAMGWIENNPENKEIVHT